MVQESLDGISNVAYTTETIVDSFEDGDIAEYSGGATGSFTVVSNPSFGAKDGTNVLRWDGGSSYDNMASTSGLDNYPGKGDTFRFYNYYDNGGTQYISNNFGCEAEGSDVGRYRTYVYDGTFYLVEQDGGGSLDQQTNVTTPTGEWFYIEIDWGTDDTITATLYDSTDTQLAQLSGTDATHASATGVGFGAYDDTTGQIYVDYVVIP